MTTSSQIGDLSETDQRATQADLQAGSAGYQHFLEHLSAYISPTEAMETRHRFHRARRRFWQVVAGFFILYAVLNSLLGLGGLYAVGWGNDYLRGLLLLAVATLAGRYAISVAGHLLLPLASLCFLPLPLTHTHENALPFLVFMLVFLLLLGFGWCVDLGTAARGPFAVYLRWLPRLAICGFMLLNIAGWLWIVDDAPPPVLSLLASIGAVIILEVSHARKSSASDVDFLYAAAWKRWRFFIWGRALAIVLGFAPFLLFASLLDYQGQLEACLDVSRTPDIVRLPDHRGQRIVYYWQQEGRFMKNSDFVPLPNGGKIPMGVYRFVRDERTPPEDLPLQCQTAVPAIDLPKHDILEAYNELLSLSATRMTEPRFLAQMRKFETFRISSPCEFLQRMDPRDDRGLVSVEFQPAGGDQEEGMCFAEVPHVSTYNPAELRERIARHAISKWIFLVFGLCGCFFLWRRGGDSSLARWLGIWLVGCSLVPMLVGANDSILQITHWMWQQTVTHHSNTLISGVQWVFILFCMATVLATVLWMFQVPLAVCWLYVCWPTRIYPRFPAIVRHLLIAAKMAAILAFTFLSFVLVFVLFGLLGLNQHTQLAYAIFVVLLTGFFILSGCILRHFTRQVSEVPRMGVWPVLALVALNFSLLSYVPITTYPIDGIVPPAFLHLGAAFGCVFIGIMGYLILKRDFLRVRAISSFTTLILLLFVPFCFNEAEQSVPGFLMGPFFHERGAQLVGMFIVLLVFPLLHHRLHELLLAISFPRLRKIEHAVEHAMEAIVEKEDDLARIPMVTHFFQQLGVPRYLLLSRRPRGVFVVDIDKLDPGFARPVELSGPLLKFLGPRRNLVDMQRIAYEWPFFFHQYELFRISQATGCRYLLPVSIGKSLRALLLIPHGSETVVATTPGVSENISDLGIATALAKQRA